MSVSLPDKVDMLRSIIAAKRAWLQSFSQGRNKRPDHEIAQRRREVEVLQAILADYEGGDR